MNLLWLQLRQLQKILTGFNQFKTARYGAEGLNGAAYAEGIPSETVAGAVQSRKETN